MNLDQDVTRKAGLRLVTSPLTLDVLFFQSASAACLSGKRAARRSTRVSEPGLGAERLGLWQMSPERIRLNLAFSLASSGLVDKSEARKINALELS